MEKNQNEFRVDETLISVIVPVYNVERFLPQCIESICNQTYKNLEIILVDDGSSDCSAKICDDYAALDRRIKVIHKKNGGQGLARNVGIKEAVGRYIAFVDADDTVLPQMYEILYLNLQTSNADISACTRMQIMENDMTPDVSYDVENELKNIRIYSGREATKELLQGHWVFKNAVWEKIYKREIFDELSFRSVYAEDREIMYKLLYKAESIVYTDLKLYCYRQRNGSTMLSNWNDYKDNAVYEQDEECIKFFEERGDSELRDAAIYWHIFWGIENYRRLRKENSKYIRRLKNEIRPYARMNYLLTTDYPIRRKIEFWIFGLFPKFHYYVCNIVRLVKRRNVK